MPVPAAEVGGQPELFPPRIAPKWNGDGDSQAAGSDQDASAQTNVSMGGNESSTDADGAISQQHSRTSPAYLETLHFFGVFDGHGGAEAALHCAQHLHQRIAEALAEEMDLNIVHGSGSSGVPCPSSLLFICSLVCSLFHMREQPQHLASALPSELHVSELHRSAIPRFSKSGLLCLYRGRPSTNSAL